MNVLNAAIAADFVKGIAPVAKHVVARTPGEAHAFADKTWYPVVLKALSPKIIHKTEAGAVQVVHGIKELDSAFSALKKLAPDILVQQFVPGTEFIIGLKNDPSFGHVVLVGIGGIYVEVYKDVSFRACPINAAQAEAMIDDLKGANILTARGKKLNRKSLVDAIVKLSKLPEKQPKISELDINPFILNEKEGVIVDARVVLE